MLLLSDARVTARASAFSRLISGIGRRALSSRPRDQLLEILDSKSKMSVEPDRSNDAALYEILEASLRYPKRQRGLGKLEEPGGGSFCGHHASSMTGTSVRRTMLHGA